jgi:hypothetical protein
VPLSDLVRTVREHQLEGLVAKRAGSEYRSGERSTDWVKWRANRGQEFVIGGYTLNGSALDSILVGYYKGRDFMYAGSVRAGIASEFRPVLVPYFEKLRITRCPFTNLPEPEPTEGRSGEGLTAAKMTLCRWSLPESSSWNGRLRIGCVTRGSPASEATRMPVMYFENQAKLGSLYPEFGDTNSPFSSPFRGCRCGAQIAGAKTLPILRFANNAGKSLKCFVPPARHPSVPARGSAESAEPV